MGNKIRWVKPDQVYEISLRTVDRQFLFVPNHHPENPLLASSCPLNALDTSNDLIPEPSIINIIGAAVGRALEANPVRLHSFEVNVNHLHEELSADEDQVDNMVGFMRSAHSAIARGVNKTWDREGHVFGGKARIHPCIDDKAAEQKLLYAITNPVKDNLLESPSKSPLFSTYEHQARGKPLRFWYIDWDAYWKAGGKRKKSHRVKDYLKWVTWSCAPLPSQLNMTESQRQTWMRKQVKAIVDECRQTRRQEGKSVLGKRALFDLDPRDRPKNPKSSGNAPLCHASDKAIAKEYRKQWREFVHQFIQASADYRRGDYYREFPEGSYRPPLVKIYKAEGT